LTSTLGRIRYSMWIVRSGKEGVAEMHSTRMSSGKKVIAVTRTPAVKEKLAKI